MIEHDNSYKVDLKDLDMSRFEILGKFEAEIIKDYIRRLPISNRKRYTLTLIEELGRYSLIGKKRRDPENEGCVRELKDFNFNDFDSTNPEHYAIVIRERLHTKYQKQNTGKELKTLIKESQKIL